MRKPSRRRATCTPGFARTRPASRRCTGRNLPTPSPKRGRSADRISRGEPELSGPADRAEQVPDEAAAALRAWLGIRRRGSRRWATASTHLKLGDAVAAFGGTGGFATHAASTPLVMPLPPGFAFDDAAAFVLTYGTTHHALVDRAAAQGGRDRAGARRCRRRGHGSDPDRQGPGRARHCRGLHRREVRAVRPARRRRDHQLRHRQPSRSSSRRSPPARAPTSSTTRSAATSPSRCSARLPGAGVTWWSVSPRAVFRRCR